MSTPGLGRRQLRHVVADWFAPPHVLGLAVVLAAMPKLLQGQDMWTPDVAGSAAGAYVTLARDSQHRIAIGGASSGQKLRVYQATLNIAHKTDSTGTDTGGIDPGVTAMDAYDDLVEAVIGRLLADRTLGGTVWQAGEGDRLFGEDIVIGPATPRQSAEAGTVWVFGAVTFTVIDALPDT